MPAQKDPRRSRRTAAPQAELSAEDANAQTIVGARAEGLGPAAARGPAPKPRIAPEILALAWLASVALAAAGAGGAAYTIRGRTAHKQATAAEARLAAARLETEALRAERSQLVHANTELRDRLNEYRANALSETTPFALDSPVTCAVGPARCELLFERAAPQLPHLRVSLAVVNTGENALPGLVQVTIYGENGVEIARANVNLFGEGSFERLAPGDRREASGSVRIPADAPPPARFGLRFRS